MADYVELHCHSNFSLLDGADHPETLVARAAELGMPALALTDHDAVYGAVHFARAAQLHGIRPIFGAEVTLTGGGHLTYAGGQVPLRIDSELHRQKLKQFIESKFLQAVSTSEKRCTTLIAK